MRELNRSLLLDITKRDGPLSRAALAKSSQLAKPTVSAIIEDLIENGLVREIGSGPISKGGGRRPVLLEFNPRSQFVAGVHIGAETTTVALSDGIGQEIARSHHPTPREDASATLAVVEDLVNGLLRRARTARKRVVGVGVSMPGQVDTHSGVCHIAPQLGWREQPVGQPLQDALKMPVFTHNIAQSTVLAEQREGAAKDAGSVAVFLEDNGISGALLIEGRTLHGSLGIAGEIGHIRLHGENAQCRCGGRGCLEALASASAVAQRAAGVTGSSVQNEPADRIFARLAASDDPRVHDLLAQVGQELGIAASWLLNLYNPDVLLLAGGFLEAGDRLLTPLRATAIEATVGQVNASVQIRNSVLGRDAPLRGAVLLALQEADHSYRLALGRQSR